MSGNDEFMRFMAAWALVHETADEGWKAAVERGSQSDRTGRWGLAPRRSSTGSRR